MLEALKWILIGAVVLPLMGYVGGALIAAFLPGILIGAIR